MLLDNTLPLMFHRINTMHAEENKHELIRID